MAVLLVAVTFTSASWFAVVGGLVVVGLFVISVGDLRCRADADIHGVRVRNRFRTHQIAWTEVTAIEVRTERLPFYRTLIYLRLREQSPVPILATARFETGESPYATGPSAIARQRKELETVRTMSADPADLVIRPVEL
jgi:hypothetical protein